MPLRHLVLHPRSIEKPQNVHDNEFDFAHACFICAPMTPTCWSLTINERGSPQRLLHKVAIEVWLRIVHAFHTSLRYDGTVVRRHNEVILPGFSRLLRIFGCH